LAKAGVLANSFPLLSQGTSFMLSGDEFSRTKADNSNSYNASYKINELNYDLKARFSDFVGYYEKLIALKTSVDGLHLKAAAAASVEVEALANGEIIKQVFKDTAASKEYVAYHVSGDATTAYPSIDLTGYDLYLDTFGNARSGSFIPSKYEVIVGVKSL
jgi:pullulanase/glycogen debranching enzyme